jgi:flagellar motor switch protein FliG
MNDLAVPTALTRPAVVLTRAQKAAIILCLLDKDGAAPLFEELGEPSVKTFVRVMADIGVIDGETVRGVVDEFVSGLLRRGDTVMCGSQAALEIVENNLGRAVAARISDSIDMFAEKNVWKRVAMVSPEVISDFVAREHPQSAAVILTKLPPEFSGRVLSEVPADQARQIAKFFRSMKGIGTKSAEIIGESLGGFLTSNRLNASALTPAERMGAIMNYASTQMREDLIEHLDEFDPEFSEEVKRSMFTFVDIETRVRRTDISKIVRAVDSEILVKALAGAEGPAQKVKAFFLANIATRMSEMIAQEIKAAGTVKRKDSDKAQAEIIKAIVSLERSGEIELIKEEED